MHKTHNILCNNSNDSSREFTVYILNSMRYVAKGSAYIIHNATAVFRAFGENKSVRFMDVLVL